jgi:putative ABC transport system permease protein
LFRLVLSEAFMLVAMGSALGVGLAYAGLKAFIAAAPVELPRMSDVHMDARVFGFAAAAALLSTLICGLFPAWRLAGTDPQGAIRGVKKQESIVRRQLSVIRMGSRELLVSAEVALSTLLLVIGGLLLVSFYRVMRAPKGFETAHVITQDVSLGGPNYSEDRNRIRYVDEALRRIEEIPGVQAVGATNWLPVRGETWFCGLGEGSRPRDKPIAIANFRFVSPGYWTAMGIALKQGRFLQPTDRGRDVAVLDEQAARLLWPGQDPIGKTVWSCGDREAKPLEVAGVVGQVRSGLEKAPPVTVYQSYLDASFGSRSFVVRTAADPAAMMSAVRGVLRSVDAQVALSQAATMEQIVDESVAARRFQTELAVVFAVAALALASLGVYGVISFTVARRTPEIGIRMALGARGVQVAAMVLRCGMAPVAMGLAAGIACALLAAQLVASQLYSVAPNDPITIATVALVLLVVAAGACWVPARRAMRVDSMRALRFE